MQPAGPTRAPIEEGHGVVLVVEDDPDVRATTSSMLRELGYGVREAETGRSALALIESVPAIDLVFTDVIMPDGMNGIELARELGRTPAGAPRVAELGCSAACPMASSTR